MNNKTNVDTILGEISKSTKAFILSFGFMYVSYGWHGIPLKIFQSVSHRIYFCLYFSSPLILV